jgi:hypothetical protein
MGREDRAFPSRFLLGGDLQPEGDDILTWLETDCKYESRALEEWPITQKSAVCTTGLIVLTLPKQV